MQIYCHPLYFSLDCEKRQRQAGGVSVSDFLKCKHTIEIRTYKKCFFFLSCCPFIWKCISNCSALQWWKKEHRNIYEKSKNKNKKTAKWSWDIDLFVFIYKIDISIKRYLLLVLFLPFYLTPNVYAMHIRGVHITNKSIVAVRNLAHLYAVAAKKNNRNRINQMQIVDLSSSLSLSLACSHHTLHNALYIWAAHRRSCKCKMLYWLHIARVPMVSLPCLEVIAIKAADHQ